jgi:hypothetical protein
MERINQNLEKIMLEEWEIWVSVMDGTDEPYVLYVLGDVLWPNKLNEPVLRKRKSNHTPADELHLELRPGVLPVEGPRKEIRYSEHLDRCDQYRSVSIFAGDKLLTRVDGIEQFEY